MIYLLAGVDFVRLTDRKTDRQASEIRGSLVLPRAPKNINFEKIVSENEPKLASLVE